MFRISLGGIVKKHASRTRPTDFFLLFGLSFVGVSSAPVSAGYLCTTVQDCSMKQVSDGYELTCRPVTNCVYVPDPPTPQPQPSAPPPPPPKSPEEIEREQHEKFCREFASRIDSAVKTCHSNALQYHDYFVNTKCSDITSSVWNIGLNIKDIFYSNYTRTIEPGTTCRADATTAMRNTIELCYLSGDKYQAALKNQCSNTK